MYFKNLTSCVVAMIVFLFITDVHADNLSKNIFVSNAWVRTMPPSQSITAAYMVITNNSTKEAVLVSASSDIAGATEIHQMSDKNGMMKMAMIPNLHIPALGKLTLQPDGFHIMLIYLKKPVNKGDIIPITLYFQDGSSIVVNAQAKPQQEEDPSSMPGMKM